MFTSHVTKKLSALLNGELTSDESNRVRQHLIGCKRCRAEYEEIKLGVQLAERIQLEPAPQEIWNEIENALDRGEPRLVLREDSRTFYWASAVAVAAMLIVAIAAGVWFSSNQAQKVFWPVQEAIGGDVRIGGGKVTDVARLRVGETLETGNSSSAKVLVADIGEVVVAPNTKLRLVDTDEKEHRMALDHGRIHAKISAPPRLFFVDTPSAQAIDLGCEYTLEVDDAGDSLLHVTLGFVALMRDGREVWLPRYAMCQARHGLGPGTPYFEDASEEFIAALAKFDFEGKSDEALAMVLKGARERDTFTLWSLLPRVSMDQRKQVLERMIELVKLPKGITREGTLTLDPGTLEAWKEAMDTVWF